MQHTKVIVDTYPLTNGGVVNVQGRYNHVSSTEVDIERDIKITFQQAEVEEKYADGFVLASQPLYNQITTEDVNILVEHAKKIKIKTKNCALNRSIDSLRYQPSGSNNAYECLPKEQAILLPYLCEHVARDNLIFAQPQQQIVFPVHDPPEDIWYDPSFFGDMLISTFANADLHATAERYTQQGLTPRNLVEFEGEVDGLIPCVYIEETDAIRCAPTWVDIHGSVFGLGVDEPTKI